MGFAIVVAFVAWVCVEVFVIVQAVHAIGTVATVALLILVPFVGVRYVKREGVGALRRLQSTVANRELPAAPLLDGALILTAGACLIVPGFVTDAIGLLLLLPPVRALARVGLRWVLFRRVAGASVKFLP